jgi:hypothetical protein
LPGPAAPFSRHSAALPEGVRAFFAAFLTAKSGRIPFEWREAPKPRPISPGWLRQRGAFFLRKCEIGVTRRKTQPKLAKGISMAVVNQP